MFELGRLVGWCYATDGVTPCQIMAMHPQLLPCGEIQSAGLAKSGGFLG